ncbi:MAG: SMC-Scp complex subunit ScpB [Clostridiales Family XIII bacterium]|jgi:segregation and condensation protein B|nr:SMC-Scp complex subunit ScpB [Clostridiales Family XIII bacterium]
MPDKKEIKSAFESMLFVWGDPLEVKAAADVMSIDKQTAYGYFKELQAEYQAADRGVRIREIDMTFQFVTAPGNYEYLRRLCTPIKEKRLSQAALEVLAIIAYRQPVTKGEIDAIRGVKCERTLESLMKKGLVDEVGRSAAIGRPILYGTTAEFLRHFNFESLGELPEIEDIESAIQDNDDAESPDFEQLRIDMSAVDNTDADTDDGANSGGASGSANSGGASGDA